MRLSKARIPPLSLDEMTPEQADVVASLQPRVPQIGLTLARSPIAFAAIKQLGAYLASDACGLSPRQRELVILRTAYLCRSGYEWTAHVGLGLRIGLTEAEIEQVKRGPGADWSPSDTALIRAADDLHRDQFVSDAVWDELGRHFDDDQRMDVVFVAGQYTQLAMMLNTFGVQIERDQTLDPDLALVSATWPRPL